MLSCKLVATVSEIQVILRIPFSREITYISAMIPIVDDTINKYFNSEYTTDFPVSLKRPAAVLIKQMMENPGAVLRQDIGDDETIPCFCGD